MRAALAIVVFMVGLCVSDRWPEMASEVLAKARAQVVMAVR